ncbi:MAG: hypothetical protein JNL80_01200 [Phycisphaerae bacterium]|jgi:hypothetical protein|nr:hypothetical protein [Phycisphaerae bacterium]
MIRSNGWKSGEDGGRSDFGTRRPRHRGLMQRGGALPPMENDDEPVRIVVVRRIRARTKSVAFGDQRAESRRSSLRAFIRSLLLSIKAIVRRSRNGGG